MTPDTLISKIENCLTSCPERCDCEKVILEYRDFILDAFAIKLVNTGILQGIQNTNILNETLKDFKENHK